MSKIESHRQWKAILCHKAWKMLKTSLALSPFSCSFPFCKPTAKCQAMTWTWTQFRILMDLVVICFGMSSRSNRIQPQSKEKSPSNLDYWSWICPSTRLCHLSGLHGVLWLKDHRPTQRLLLCRTVAFHNIWPAQACRPKAKHLEVIAGLSGNDGVDCSLPSQHSRHRLWEQWYSSYCYHNYWCKDFTQMKWSVFPYMKSSWLYHFLSRFSGVFNVLLYR